MALPNPGSIMRFAPDLPTQSVEFDGYATTYAETGSGEPVVLVHGSLCDWRYWKPQLAGLGKRYRALAPSLRRYWPERWDGTGYPRGLKGEDIPLAARIFSVVDVWDALSFPRVYKPAWPEEKVLDYLRDAAGGQLDPSIVGLFLEHYDDLKAIGLGQVAED